MSGYFSTLRSVMSEDPFHPERGNVRGLVGSLNVEGRVLSLVGKGATSKREAPESAAVIRRIGRDGCS